MGQAFIMPRAFDPNATPERMAAWIMQYAPASDADALKLLRARFPDHPLSLRVAALVCLMRTSAFERTYNPK
jgi:hypothetical protein